ncbi:MAG: ankyrin repeat domain-containing protein [Candidatus Rickettsia vulgarisii]
MDFLLEKGADANYLTKQGNAALFTAVGMGHYDIVESLIKKGKF